MRNIAEDITAMVSKDSEPMSLAKALGGLRQADSIRFMLIIFCMKEFDIFKDEFHQSGLIGNYHVKTLDSAWLFNEFLRMGNALQEAHIRITA